jgi:hypothetical protein
MVEAVRCWLMPAARSADRGPLTVLCWPGQGSRRRKAREKMALAAAGYAALGWPVCAGAQPREGQSPPGAGQSRACSCDRVGCPAPGAHPLSPVWKQQASAEAAVVSHWWARVPHANILLATGRVFDVLDVPAQAGLVALTRLTRAGIKPGPVALSAANRALFFVASRAALVEDDEWWTCRLDCEPETVPEITGLRWHCRDSYVVAPPSRLSSGLTARWIVEPAGALPDALRLLEILADACEENAS